ncbi:YbaB/EbfC family nucleoid-associated protein [Mycobacterium sp.]|uniref:YbaB/EbfC family nucleoid-associated protein n=1 Tax=Mycobacterium sp. TaxID=1785 RepID=UPI003BA84A01
MDTEGTMNGNSTPEDLADKLKLAQNVMDDTFQKLLRIKEQVVAKTTDLESLGANSGLELTSNILENIGANFANLQEKIAQTIFTSSSDADLVEMSLTGEGKVVSVKIDPVLINLDDISILQDFIAIVVTDLFQKISNYAKNKLKVGNM